MFASLASTRIVEGRITIPKWGAWHADVALDREVAVGANGLDLVLADLAMRCATWRDPRAWQGSTRARLIGGYGGWSTTLGPKFYRQSSGVKLSTVLSDAAREVGERVVVGTDLDVVVGALSYTREIAPAQRLLNRLAASWYVRPDGVTYVGPRTPTGAVTQPFDLISFDSARGVAVVASERLAEWTPGRTFTSPRAPGIVFTISGVEHVIVGGATVRTEVHLA